MIRVNIHEAKARLSWCLERVAAGEDVVICKHNRPVAALRVIHEPPKTARPFGHAKGRFDVPSTFFDPLPDEEIEPFNEGSPEPLRRAAGRAPVGAVAAETSQAYHVRRRKLGRRRKPGR
jgi:antitoxin (DNA-binding transcriptional repressor) of toxin-antitoxin stability system